MTNLLPSATRFDWSDAAVKRLRELVAMGRTATQIAAAIDAPTRNVVIGKANRLGLHFGVVQPVFEPKPKPKPPVERRAAPKARAMEAAMNLEPMTCDPPSEGVRLMDVRDGQCRWPMGDPRDAETFRFCGEPTERSYCVEHHSIVYVRGSEIKQKKAPVALVAG